MIITHYSCGYVGCTIYSILIILTQWLYRISFTSCPLLIEFPRLGFATTTVILGGQTLASINPGTLPLVVGIIVIGICSLIPSFIGYNMVHHYERYAWMVMTLVMLSLWGLGGKAGFDINAHTTSVNYNEALLPNNILDFGRVVFGSFTIVSTLTLVFLHDTDDVFPVGPSSCRL